MLRTTACTRALIATLALGCGDHVVSPAPLMLADALPATLLDACPAGATRWAAAVNGNWTDAARWTAGVPTAATPACIDLPGTYVVTAATLNTLPAQQLFHGVPGATTQPVLRLTRGTLAISGDASIHGRVEINAPSGVSAALDATGALMVAPTGTLTTGDNGTKTYEADALHNDGTLIVGLAPTSVSRLTVRVNTLVNRGTLTVPAAPQLFIVSAAVAGPRVSFEGGSVTGTGLLQQTGGRLDVLGGTVSGEVDLVGVAELHLGHDGGGRFNLLRTPGTTPPVTSRLTGTVGASQQVWLGNNNITVDAAGVTNAGLMTIQGDPALGTIATTLRATGGTLVNQASGTIAYAGRNPMLYGSIENHGLITTAAGPSGSIGHAALRPYPLVNHGMVRVVALSSLNATPLATEPAAHVVNRGRLELTGPYDQVGGRFEHLDGTVAGTGQSDFTSVQWLGHGTWGRALAPGGAGSLEPGASIGRLAITGDYAPSATTVTRMELGSESHDEIAVSGTARFAGALAVVTTDGFVPKPCQVFPIVTYAARTGTFSNAATPIDIGSGMKLRQVYDGTSLMLVAYSAAGANVSPTDVTVSTDGTTAKYDVCLGSVASDAVTAQPDDQVQVDRATLTFGAASLPQTVTVSAASGASRSEAFIRHSASSGTPVPTVRVTIDGVTPPDTDAPVTTATATPPANAHGWNNTSVEIRLAATDAGSGVAGIDWTLSGAQSGSGSVSGGSAVVPVTAEGISTMTYSARDVAGNVEVARTLVVRTDYTAPHTTVRLTPAPIGGVFRSDVTVHLEATDLGSGVAAIEWTLTGAQTGSGSTTPATASHNSTASVTITENGETTVAYLARDRAGNVAATGVFAVIVDKRPATIACSVTPSEIWPPNGELVPVSVTVTHERADGFVLNWVRMTEPGTDNMSGSVKGRTVGDMVDWVTGTADTQGLLRASRAGSGTGRVYTFEYRTIGGAAPATARCDVRVLHDRGRGQ